jgi:hypothetical protein
MKTNTQEIDRLILGAVSDDYENIVTMMDQRLDCFDIIRTMDQKEIERRLLSLRESGYIKAYLLSSTVPYATEVHSLTENLSTYWFFITKLGKEFLLSSPRS